MDLTEAKMNKNLMKEHDKLIDLGKKQMDEIDAFRSELKMQNNNIKQQ